MTRQGKAVGCQGGKAVSRPLTASCSTVSSKKPASCSTFLIRSNAI